MKDDLNAIMKDLEKALTELVYELKPAEVSEEPVSFERMEFDRTERDNKKWLALITPYLQRAKTFEIHCWNEERKWIELALQYGVVKTDDWKYGKIIAGEVTPDFVRLILEMPKPADTELCNKMTPFFNIFLDDCFQSCHYGTENYYGELMK